MRHAGALRIDHILGFLRLFWIPAGASPQDGAYVGYPWEELRAVLAVESHRHRCLVIGEDLGTVPPDFDQKLRAAGILSTRLFYFEKTHDGAFKPPEAYPEDAMIAIGTHDLPTFAAYWSGADHALRTRLGLWTSEAQRESEAAARARDRDAARAFIRQDAAADTPPMLPVYAALADAPSRLLMVQIEDIAGQVEQVNVPGTWREYPNWRVRVPVDASALLDSALAQALARALAQRADRPVE
jgi:(1->4)-alpha-D-glucan 1-alpha-D-glucosylmutase